MARKYRRKQALPGDPLPGPTPTGGPPGAPAPSPTPTGGPGGAPPGAPRPGLNRPPTAPPTAPGGDPNAAPPLKPRIPPPPPPDAPGMGGPGLGGGPPTDVHIDAASGEVTIKKGPVTMKIADHEFGHSTPEEAGRAKMLEQEQRNKENVCPECKGLGCLNCEGSGYIVPVLDHRRQGKKVATSEEWKDLWNGNAPTIDDSKDDLFYDTHDNLYGAPANRRTPPTVEITANVPEGQSAKALAFAYQLYTSLDVETSGQTVTIKNVTNPIGILNDLKSQGVDASVTRSGEIARSFYQSPYETYSKGEKVAVLGDVPNYNYYPNELTRKVEAYIVEKRGEKFLLNNDMWGDFEVWEDGIGRL